MQSSKRGHEMPKRLLRRRSAPPTIRRRDPIIVETPAPPSLRPPPRRSRSLPLSVKNWVINISSRLQDPGARIVVGSEQQALQESIRDTATAKSASGAYSDQNQKASGGHEAVLEHVAAQNITLAEAALAHFNAENPQDDEYMLVTGDGTKAPISRVFVHDGPWFHCNFSARAKNGDGSNRVVQFYAEIFYAETPRVMRCCILTKEAESHPDRTCGFCGGTWRRNGILHPPDVLGYQNWLGLAKGVDSFARHVHNKPDRHSRRRRPSLEQFHEMRIV